MLVGAVGGRRRQGGCRCLCVPSPVHADCLGSTTGKLASRAVLQVRFSERAVDAISCYLELAEQVRAKLSKVDEYFMRLADGMEDWIACWRALNP